MFNNKDSPNKAQKTVENSLYGMANMLAFIAAFFMAPTIFDLSAQPVYSYLLNSYSDAGIAELGMYVWTLLATATVYFLSRAVFVLALMFIAQRLLVMAF